MKIGILGAGSVGATLGKAWVKSGHEVMFGVRDVTALKVQALLAETGAIARAGTASEVVVHSEVIALALAWDVADSTAPEYQITYVVAPFNSLICRMAPPKARTFNYQVN